MLSSARFLSAMCLTATCLSSGALAQTLDAQLEQQQRATQQQMTPPTESQAPWPALGAPTGATPPAGIMAPAPMAAPAIDSLGGGAIPALPLQVMLTRGGIYFINGGIGDEELEQLKAQAPQYNVQISLSAGKGEYISGVTLRILDEKGVELVNVTDAGPYLYAKMQPGTYNIETFVHGEGIVKKTALKVPSSGTAKPHIVYQQ